LIILDGSNDGGLTIHQSEEADSIMKRASELLNLKNHFVTERKSLEKKMMSGPVLKSQSLKIILFF
jgi:hypothetical protein